MEITAKVEFNFMNSNPDRPISQCTVPCLCGNPVHLGEILSSEIHRCDQCGAQWSPRALEAQEDGSDTFKAEVEHHSYRHDQGVVADQPGTPDLESFKNGSSETVTPYTGEDDET